METGKDSLRAEAKVNWFFTLLRKISPFNRRICERFTIDNERIKCECTYEENGQKASYPITVINIAKSGLILTAKNKIYPGAELKLIFNINSIETPVTIFGTVTRTYRKLGQQIYHSAVKFESEEDEQIKLLIDEKP